jgi:two-component system sensor histidine kinase PilS (NtrC family)
MNDAQSNRPLTQTLRDSRSALMRRVTDEPDLTWRILVTLNAFRMVIVFALLILFLISSDPRVFGDRYPTVFAATTVGYLVFASLTALSLRRRWVPISGLSITQLFVDIVAVTVLLHASGGIGSGLGGLLVVFIGAGSLVLPTQYPGILAAVATFAILGEQVFSQLKGLEASVNYPAAGILGAIVFALAVAAQPLARRIQASEALARKFGIDLKNISELNEYIVQHLRECIIVVDHDDTLRLINSSAMQLLGASESAAGESLEKTSPELFHYLRRWRKDPAMTSHPEFTLITEGDNLRIIAHLAPLGTDAPRAGPVLVFLEDVSIMNERVQQSKLASLGRLSASIAHEIRNPVGAMSHAAQLLKESPGLTTEDERLTEIIQTHSSRISHIIENVLQLSRRESSRPERLLLNEWLYEFAEEFVRTHELQEGELTIGEIPELLEVRMDRSHLRQILWNLCDNAIKYGSETGGIMVEVQAGRLPNQGRPYIDVLDRGHGVDQATAEQMFEPFFTARSGGTGLGLYISRELCELNRATLVYLDRTDGGSIFRIVFADPDRWEPQDTS